MAYGHAERYVALAAVGRTTTDLAVRQVSRSLTIQTGSSARKETSMKIAILGTGGVAHALGAGWKKSGHDVVFGARNASATDPDFEITGLQEALAAGDVIVNAITGAGALQAITALDTSAMAGKTLLDASNARTGTGDLAYPNSSLR
jgi:NADP oxidoreductase coenzyme F420-dependent